MYDRPKAVISSKSLEILDEFISRAKNNELTIPKNENLKKIAATIIYTITISTKKMVKISASQMSSLVNLKNYNSITNYYNKHFKHLYPRKEFLFNVYKFGKIKQIISLYFFQLLRNTEIKTSKLVLHLKENIQKNNNLPEQITQKDIKVLQKMVTQYEDTFIIYFSDLGEVVKQLIISSRDYKKIGAHLIIKDLADFLEKDGINLLLTISEFSRSIVEIFDFLKEKYPNFFPARAYIQGKNENISEKEKKKRRKEYVKIVSSKLKLFVIKNIYKGEYFKNGKVKCPECLKEGFSANTDISRLIALEFHHDSDLKENSFTEEKLFNIFTKNRSNPYVLEYLISLMESEKVELLCRNHHAIMHDKYYNYFKYLINWENIFSLLPDLIHVLIYISIENFRFTKNLPIDKKRRIKKKIVKKLKKRYIIEHFYGEYCHTCGEFNTKENLRAFHFHHKDEKTKKIDAWELYNLSCSEIVQIFEQEKGGYICSNCHTVIHYKNLHLLDIIYEVRSVVKKILDDYSLVSKKFTLIHNKGQLIGNPLKKTKSTRIHDSFVRYLSAINEISKSGCDVTSDTLVKYLGINRASIHNFFKRNDVIKHYVDIFSGIRGSPYTPSKYILNNKGRDAISLINHFRDYYGYI